MNIVIISGAGLSAESGISTFRDADGLWETYDVMQVCSTQGWAADRALVTEFYNARRHDLEDKIPNHAHKVLASLEQRYPNKIIHLTQNVDNLMERAGAREVIHLHGTLTELRCEQCHQTWEIGYRAQRNDERCPHCASQHVRHNVVMFGEAAPNYRYIYKSLEACGVFIAIGTSAQVIDVVSMVRECQHSILINPRKEPYVTSFGDFETTIDHYFEHFIQSKAGDAMEPMMALLERYM
jgi:NAD-dependent deacetylase